MAEPGLCSTCRHCRAVQSARGSTFCLCERSRSEPAFPKYPPLPVLHCLGYETKTAHGEPEHED